MTELKNRRLFKRIRPTINYGDIRNGVTRMKIEKLDPENMENQLSQESQCPKDLVIVHKESDEDGLKGYRTFGRITKLGYASDVH